MNLIELLPQLETIKARADQIESLVARTHPETGDQLTRGDIKRKVESQADQIGRLVGQVTRLLGEKEEPQTVDRGALAVGLTAMGIEDAELIAQRSRVVLLVADPEPEPEPGVEPEAEEE